MDVVFSVSLLSTEQDFKMEEPTSLVDDNWTTSKAGKRFYFELLNNFK